MKEVQVMKITRIIPNRIKCHQHGHMALANGDDFGCFKNCLITVNT